MLIILKFVLGRKRGVPSNGDPKLTNYRSSAQYDG